MADPADAKRCAIVGGAPIGRPDRIVPLLRDGDFFVYCDSGLKHLDTLGRRPDLIIGDFDSWRKPDSSDPADADLQAVETIVLPREKDDTDTMFAVKEGLARGFSDFLLVGALGGRMDHTLVNLYSLIYLAEKGKNGLIADDYSLFRIVDTSGTCVGPKWPFFSLVNLDGSAHGVTIRRAKFELEDAEIPCGYQYATSNEPLPGVPAEVSLREGRLLLICDWE
ncbi:MAG: thiamine diphosphokinase [Clostridia bacterium]|nr:thiamine diphosphokinase [Clostridia bacterium]